MTNADTQKRAPSELIDRPEARDRRDAIRMILGTMGALAAAAATAGCSEGAPQPEALGQVTDALSGTSFIWFDTVAGATFSLRTQAGTANGQVAVVQGYSAQNDGGGGLFYWDSSSMTPDDQGTIIAASGTSRGRWIRIRNNQVDVRWFGAKAGDPTAASSNSNAFNAALRVSVTDGTAGPTDRGITLVIDGWFYMQSTLEIVRQGVTVRGSGKGFYGNGHKPGSMLLFPKNVTGVRIHSSGDIDFGTGITAGSGEFCTIRDITLACTDASTTSGHGVHASIQFHAENVLCANFGGNGFNLAANPSAGHSPDANNYPPGNVASTQLAHCHADQNKQHGFYIYGGDASICLIQKCDATANQGWGFWDSSGSGNTYLACHAEGNLGNYPIGTGLGNSIDGQNHDYYCVATANVSGANQSAFVGCYTEASINRIQDPAIVLGGTLANHALTADSNAFVLNGRSVTQSSLTFRYDGGNAGSTVGGGLEVGGVNSQQVLDFQSGFSTPNGSSHIQVTYDETSKYWTWGESIYHAFWQWPTSQATPRAYAPLFVNGYVLSDGSTRNPQVLHLAAPAVPTVDQDNNSRRYLAGDVVWNSAPAVGGPVGWVCVTAGTGSAAVFKPFATIAA